MRRWTLPALMAGNSLLCAPAEAVFHAGLNLGATSFTKTSMDGTVAGFLPVGMEFSGGLFVLDNVSLDGAAELNLELGQMSMVFMGGEGLVSYYIAGGDPVRMNADGFVFDSDARFNLYAFMGLGQRTFNFTAFEAGGKTGIRKRAENNPVRGAFFAPTFGLGASVPIFQGAHVTSRVKIVQGLGDPTTPAIRMMGFFLGMGTAL